MAVRVEHGDSRDVLKSIATGSIDACVTDPPYSLVSIQKRFGKAGSAPAQEGRDGLYRRAAAGFMGKQWDTGETAFDPAFWREVCRVLKPGAHVVAFSGTRTYHRMACAIEDAGFEIRDQIGWLYGSGFPKSHDVSKGIDKADAIGARRERALKFTAWMRSRRISARLINDLTQSNMGSHYLTDREQPEIATESMFSRLRPALGEIPDWIEDLVRSRTVESENLKRRQVIARSVGKDAVAGDLYAPGSGQYIAKEFNRTTDYSEEAKAWEGWGTALKPAWEPVCLARKPLDGTVAENVLEHGTGAVNIDGCRIEGETLQATDGVTRERRWPANVIHDGSEEVSAAFPGEDGGTAARFFYSAKADVVDRFGSKHPTVKPIDLIAYLCRLITPPGGTVLDPFAGSGTTGAACIREGFDCILIEREAEYIPDIHARLEFASGEGRHSLEIRGRHVPEEKRAGADLPLFGGGGR
jgi:DNA modification methylase